jgi:DNA adenine methylase
MANYINFKVRPIIKYFGGKSFLARRIIEHLADCHTYVEPFAGGLNVLINKCKSSQEIVGDLNTELIHLYQIIQTQSSTLLDQLKTIPYTEEVFLAAKNASPSENPITRALNFLIKHRMSRSGMGRDFSRFSDEGDEDSWNFLAEDLTYTAHRLKDVQFYNEPALHLIDRFDSPDTCFYLDPPYYPTTRESPKVYQHEMTQFQHLLLLKRILKCQGHVVISGYDNPVYARELAGWERYSFSIANHSGQTSVKSKRVEVIWVKPQNL